MKPGMRSNLSVGFQMICSSLLLVANIIFSLGYLVLSLANLRFHEDADYFHEHFYSFGLDTERTVLSETFDEKLDKEKEAKGEEKATYKSYKHETSARTSNSYQPAAQPTYKAPGSTYAAPSANPYANSGQSNYGASSGYGGYETTKQPYAGSTGYGTTNQPYAGSTGYGTTNQPYAGSTGYGTTNQPYAASTGYGTTNQPYGVSPDKVASYHRQLADEDESAQNDLTREYCDEIHCPPHYRPGYQLAILHFSIPTRNGRLLDFFFALWCLCIHFQLLVTKLSGTLLLSLISVQYIYNTVGVYIKLIWMYTFLELHYYALGGTKIPKSTIEYESNVNLLRWYLFTVWIQYSVGIIFFLAAYWVKGLPDLKILKDEAIIE